MPISPPGNQLGEHGIIVDRHLEALVDPAIIPNAWSGRRSIEDELSGERSEVVRRVLGVDATLDRVAPPLHLLLTEGKGLPGGDPDLALDQVDPRGELGHRMFHLEPGVDLQEVKVPVGIDQELGGSRVPVAASASERHGGFSHPLAELRGHDGRRGLFHHLLMAALQRTLAFPQIQGVAGRIGQDLYLDVAWTNQIFLDEDCGITE